jgi:glycosyltransferase involved in cell wall biosynthesis
VIVAQIVEGDAPGGTERLMIQMSLELRRRGHEVVAVGPAAGPGRGWLGNQMRSLGFAWDTIPKRSMFDPRAVSDIVALIRRHSVAVVHSHEFAPSVFGAAATRLTGSRHVMTMHSNLYFATAWRRRVAFRWAARRSAVVAVSDDTRSDAERVLGLAQRTIRVIPNGIAPAQGAREPLRRELGLSDDDLLVAAVGNVSPRKAHALILRALLELRERRPEVRWRLAIAGTDQGSAPELLALASEACAGERVHLLGHRADTENVLAAADVFAMSSLHEGMPLAIMEAMFASCAIVTSRAGGIAEMLTHDVEGLLVPVGEVEALSAGLERLLCDASLRRRLGEAARARAARQFGIAPMMDAYLELYGGGV